MSYQVMFLENAETDIDGIDEYVSRIKKAVLMVMNLAMALPSSHNPFPHP